MCFLLLILPSHSWFHHAIVGKVISVLYQLERYKQTIHYSCTSQILSFFFKGNAAAYEKHSADEKWFFCYREGSKYCIISPHELGILYQILHVAFEKSHS